MNNKIKKLYEPVYCPICNIKMIREGNEINCPKCGFGSPIILVNHKVK